MNEFSRSCRPMLLILGLSSRSKRRLAIRGMRDYGTTGHGAKRSFTDRIRVYLGRIHHLTSRLSAEMPNRAERDVIPSPFSWTGLLSHQNQSAIQDRGITVASCEVRRFVARNPSHLLSTLPLRDPNDLRLPILQSA